tara:strand:- start:271 stop:759 length:489 start_codon:yes stop_codon:yes gene_type:complete
MTPNILIHEVVNTGSVNGTLPDGTLDTFTSDAPSYGGRTHLYKGCTVAGRFDSGSRGCTLYGLNAQIAGSGGFTLYLRDNVTKYPGGTVPSVIILSSTDTDFTNRTNNTEQFAYTFTTPVLVLPGYSLEFVATNALTAEGRLTFVLSQGLTTSSGYVSIVQN